LVPTIACWNVLPPSVEVATTVASRSGGRLQAAVAQTDASYATYRVPSRPMTGLEPCAYGVTPLWKVASVGLTGRAADQVLPKSLLAETTIGDSR
jgi:hypothetical protein